MKSYILTKWVEPYVLLETAKKSFEMAEDFTFDGFSKLNIKKEFIKNLNSSTTFGLYMKNVNKFYLFKSSQKIDIMDFLTNKIGLSEVDFHISDDPDEPFNMVDMGKAEASFLV